MIKKITRVGLVLWLSGSMVFIQAQKLNIGFVYPAGGQQGTSFEVEVGGQNLQDLTGVYVSGEGVSGTLIQDKTVQKQPKKRKKKKELSENEQIAERVKLRLTIQDKAEPGLRDFRLVTGSGVSNRLFFEVGQLPNFLEESKQNPSFESAGKAPATPFTLNGQILPGEKDYFRFQAKKGENLVCWVKARTLMPYLADAVPGWFQSVVTLYDSKGKEVAFCDDYKFHPDPLIVYTVPETGDYTLEIKDAIYRGREDFVYRIDVGEIPFIYDIFPLGGQKNKQTKVAIHGVNLPTENIKVKPAKNSPPRLSVYQKNKQGLQSNRVLFEVGELTELLETPSSKQKPMKINLNTLVNGKISAPFEEDWFEFFANKGERVLVEVNARKLGSPIDAKLYIYNAEGKLLKENDDVENLSEGLETHHADPSLVFRAGREGVFRIRLVDSQNHGGNDHAYRLKLTEAQPDFDLRIEPSSIIIPRDGTSIFTVFALRKNKFNDDIRIRVDNLPSGFAVSNTLLRKGTKQLRMTITAPPSAEEKKLDLPITGVATDAKGNKIERIAQPAEEMMQAFYIPHLVPTQDFNVSVAPEQPFSLKILSDISKPIRFSSSQAVRIKLRIDRKEGFNETIQIVTKAFRFIRNKPIEVPADQNEIELELEYFSKNNRKSTQAIVPVILSGIVKGKKTRGKGNAFKASVIAYAPSFEVELAKDLVGEKKNASKKK